MRSDRAVAGGAARRRGGAPRSILSRPRSGSASRRLDRERVPAELREMAAAERLADTGSSDGTREAHRERRNYPNRPPVPRPGAPSLEETSSGREHGGDLDKSAGTLL